MPEPRTIAFDAQEWQAVCIHNANRLTQFLQNLPSAPSDTDMVAITEHMQRMAGVLLPAWQRSVPAVQKVEPPVEQVAQPSPKPNGAAKPKRGWPKGKPRKPVQQAAAQ